MTRPGIISLAKIPGPGLVTKTCKPDFGKPRSPNITARLAPRDLTLVAHQSDSGLQRYMYMCLAPQISSPHAHPSEFQKPFHYFVYKTCASPSSLPHTIKYLQSSLNSFSSEVLSLLSSPWRILSRPQHHLSPFSPWTNNHLSPPAWALPTIFLSVLRCCGKTDSIRQTGSYSSTLSGPELGTLATASSWRLCDDGSPINAAL